MNYKKNICKVIYDAPCARYLLNRGHKVVDLIVNDESFAFVFLDCEELRSDMSEYSAKKPLIN